MAYSTLPVKSRTLENLGNFKKLVSPVTRRIPNITKFQAFQIYKEGSEILVKVKRKTHHSNWLGFTADGKTAGAGEGFNEWRLMLVGSVRLEKMPRYHLKKVDPNVIHQIELRQEASWKRLADAFPGGEYRRGGLALGSDVTAVGGCASHAKRYHGPFSSNIYVRVFTTC